MTTPLRLAFSRVLTAVLVALVSPCLSSSLTLDEARVDLSWRAELKGLAETDSARILDSFQKLLEFVTVREAHSLCVERMKHIRPPVPEERRLTSPASSQNSAAPGGRAEGVSDAAEGTKAVEKKRSGKRARKIAKTSAKPDGRLDHELLGLDQPLFPSILDGTQ